MTSIGPELPPHLHAQQAPADDDSEEEVPQPQPEPSASSSVGSQVPAHLQPSAGPPDNPDSDDEDDYVPALPPDMLAARAAPAPKKVIGPAMPPGFGRGAEAESDDDDVGPKPPPAHLAGSARQTDGVKQFLEQEEARRKRIEEASRPKALKRDEWMLTPPSASELLGKLDPTKLNKPRQFARSSAPAPSASKDASLWTETPAERQQRLADEVSGKKRKATAAADALTPEELAEQRKKMKRDEEIRRGVQEHTAVVRGGALVSRHEQALQSKPSDSDEPKAIWDRERDMSLGGRLMDDSQRKKMLRDAKALGERFGTGSSGGFL